MKRKLLQILYILLYIYELIALFITFASNQYLTYLMAVKKYTPEDIYDYFVMMFIHHTWFLFFIVFSIWWAFWRSLMLAYKIWKSSERER